MIKLLSIGNSFSADALSYFRDMAALSGAEIDVTHVLIGGCSLERHYNNLIADLPEYTMSKNGVKVEGASLCEVIENNEFDIVTIQQVSHFSGLYSTYHPYIDELIAYIKRHQTKARLWLHKTWAYEKNSSHSGFAAYCNDQQIMYKAICKVCDKIFAECDIDGIIPSGDVIQALRETPEFNFPQEPSLCRDGFHMHLLYGRFAVAATWLETLCGVDVRQNTYTPPESVVGVLGDSAKHRLDVIRTVVHDVCSQK